MTPTPTVRRALSLLADMLNYPTPGLAERALICAEALAPLDAEAAEHVRTFAAWAAEAPRGRQEEVFTRTFDLQATCFPYVSYHLFGESYKRGGFLARLNEEYQRRGFSVSGELPDHLAVLLRFLAEAEEDEVTQDLRDFCLAPALERMKQAFGKKPGPYQHIILALARLFPPVAVGAGPAEWGDVSPLPLNQAAGNRETATPTGANGCGPDCAHLNLS